MKKIIIIFTLILLFLITTIGSWFLFNDDLSFYKEITHSTAIDGVHYFNSFKMKRNLFSYTMSSISPDEFPTPDGFNLSPQDVDFIYSSLLRNAWHFGASTMTTLYYDTNNYYVSKNYDIYNDLDSLLKNTIHINGHDGRVFNALSNIWENVGYIHMTYPEVVNHFTNGTPRLEVIEKMGHAFESYNPSVLFLFCPPPNFLETTNITEALEYWCRDGNFIIYFMGEYVSSIITNPPIGRL